MASTIVTTTRSGRVVRAPINEYTDRVYTPGSRCAGADQYDRHFGGNKRTITPKQESRRPNRYDYNDGFIIRQGEEEDEEETKATSESESEMMDDYDTMSSDELSDMSSSDTEDEEEEEEWSNSEEEATEEETEETEESEDDWSEYSDNDEEEETDSEDDGLADDDTIPYDSPSQDELSEEEDDRTAQTEDIWGGAVGSERLMTMAHMLDQYMPSGAVLTSFKEELFNAMDCYEDGGEESAQIHPEMEVETALDTSNTPNITYNFYNCKFKTPPPPPPTSSYSPLQRM